METMFGDLLRNNEFINNQIEFKIQGKKKKEAPKMAFSAQRKQ